MPVNTEEYSTVPKGAMDRYSENMQAATLSDNPVYPEDIANEITISINASPDEKKDLVNLPDNTRVYVKDNLALYDETYYSELYKIMSIVESSNTRLTFIIPVKKRSIFNQSGILDEKYNNIDINIYTCKQEYTLVEYLQEEKIIGNLIGMYLDDTFTPFEKYVLIYNFVKNYAPYLENEEAHYLSADIKYVLSGKYIVCEGFANLLTVFLDKAGIDAYYYRTKTLDENEMNEKDEDGNYKDIDLENYRHARVLVRLNDPKYRINKIFICDPTWDNDEKSNEPHHKLNDYYNHIFLDIDSMQKSFSMFSLELLDLLIDVHSFEEFNTKVNVLLRKMMRMNIDAPDSECNLMWSYSDIFNLALNFMNIIDTKEYNKNCVKYLVEYSSNDNLDEQFYKDFLTYFGNYIVDKVNKKTPIETVISGIISAKNKELPMSKEQMKRLRDYLKRSLAAGDDAFIPYELTDDYNSNDLVEKTPKI